jgi:hypothetical protein
MRVLQDAGWRSGRCVSDLVRRWRDELSAGDGFVMTAAAERALEEFGGLTVNQDGPGKECARSSFEIDPMLAFGETDRFGALGAVAGDRLYPLGEAVGGHVFLAIGDSGRVYMVDDEILLVGETVHDALEALVLGLKPQFIGRWVT